MGKKQLIKISDEFKEFLVGEKKEGEDFEATIKRLITLVNHPSIPVNQAQYTSKPDTQTDPLVEVLNNENNFVEVELGLKVEKSLYDSAPEIWDKEIDEPEDKSLEFVTIPQASDFERIKHQKEYALFPRPNLR